MLDEASERGLNHTAARSADFYGPGASTSAFNTFAVDKVTVRREPTWLFDATQPHAMTYTPDIGKALAQLGTDATGRGRGRTSHLPTSAALTGEEYLQIAIANSGAFRHRSASRHKRTSRHKTMTLLTMRMGAPFLPIARETLEMAYQNMARTCSTPQPSSKPSDSSRPRIQTGLPRR